MNDEAHARRKRRGRRATDDAAPRFATRPLVALRRLAAAPLLALLCLLCLTQTRAQEAAPASTAGGAVRFDEYGRVGHCDLGARLDNFANELQANPSVTGYLVGYDSVKGSPGVALHSVEMQRRYMVYSRGIDESRLVAIRGGRHEGAELKTELWLVPPGAEPPFKARSADDEPPVSGKFGTFWRDDDSAFSQADGMGGPGSDWITRKAFADALKRQPKSKAYLVAFTDGERTQGAWRRFATSEKVQLEAEGVEPARLHVVNGGRREASQVELWIVPEDAPPPVKPAKREKPLREAVMIGAHTRLGDEEDKNERRWLLENFAEMLRADPQRVGVLVVFAEAAPARLSDYDGTLEESFDYAKLAGEWKQELTARYGVEAHRVVVRVGSAGESQASGIETWVVPKGAALPDPNEIARQREAEANAGDEPEEGERPDKP